MAAISKILLPVDFSAQGAGAARYAAALAHHFKAELTVLHVLDTFTWAPASAWEYGSEFQVAAFEAFRDQRKRETQAYGREHFHKLNVKRTLLTGDPGELIVQHAKEDGSDLIVMSTHGRGRFRRFLLGSVTSKVLHDATCPVWTGVHMNETSQLEWKVINHVICALDNGPESRDILRWAADFAGEFAARLTIVHAIPPISGRVLEYVDPHWWDTLASQAREDILGIKLEAGVNGGDILIEKGEPAAAISEAARRLNADLMVIGRNSAEGLLSRLREHAYFLVRESPCPVVSV